MHALVAYLSSLLRGESITLEEKGLIISSLHSEMIRDTLSEFLKTINAPKQLERQEPLTTLGDILKYSLTAFLHERDENYKLVYAILHCSQLVFFIEPNGTRLFLTNLLNDHGIWQEP